MFGKAGLGNLMKQAQEMQAKMKKAQEGLATLEVVGEAGAGAVKVSATCNHVIKRIEITDADLLQDKEMLEDLVTAAVNDVMQKITVKSSAEMGQFTGGLNLPAGMGDLFK